MTLGDEGRPHYVGRREGFLYCVTRNIGLFGNSTKLNVECSNDWCPFCFLLSPELCKIFNYIFENFLTFASSASWLSAVCWLLAVLGCCCAAVVGLVASRGAVCGSLWSGQVGAIVWPFLKLSALVIIIMCKNYNQKLAS